MNPAKQQTLPPVRPQPRSLQEVLRNPAIWRARQLAEEQGQEQGKGKGKGKGRGQYQTIATGFTTLDAVLPDGGWPQGALTELLLASSGIGELSLLLPALRQVCAQGRGIALLAPPWLPYARRWESAGLPLDKLLLVEATSSDLLWSAEQILRSGECGALVLWGQAAGRTLDHRALQRLQLAAVSGKALGFVYRPWSAQANPSPAPLRLKLEAREGGLGIHIIKQRGALPLRSIQFRSPAFSAPESCSPAF